MSSPPYLSRTFHALVRGKPYVRLTLEHTEACLRAAGIPILVVISPIGAVIVLQGLLVFAELGAREMIGSTLTSSMLLEVAPAFVALLLATQVGSSYAAELGTMIIGQETDYHEVTAVDPYARLVVPRVVALVLAAPLLATLAAAAGILVGGVVAVTRGHVSAAGMIENAVTLTSVSDLFVCLAKATAFGLVVGLVSTRVGMSVSGGSAAVGQAANRAIVHSILACVVLNYVLATVLLGGSV